MDSYVTFKTNTRLPHKYILSPRNQFVPFLIRDGTYEPLPIRHLSPLHQQKVERHVGLSILQLRSKQFKSNKFQHFVSHFFPPHLFQSYLITLTTDCFIFFSSSLVLKLFDYMNNRLYFPEMI